jgi:serine/threonine-protein kinase
MMRAVEYYQKALEEDRKYSLAYAGMSLCYSHLAYWDYLPAREALPLAKRAAMRAFKLNHTSGEVLRSVALVKIYYEWDWEGADVVTKKALEVAPYSESSHTTRAIFLLATKRLEGAIAEGRRALEVDPLSITANSYLGLYFLRAGYLNTAVEQFRKTLELDPNHPRARWLLGQSLLLSSDVDEGLSEIERAVEQSDRNPVILSGLGWAYAQSGRRSAAQRVIQELEAMGKARQIRPYLFAKIYCGLGQDDLAFEWLERALGEHDLSLTFISTDECFETLRFDTRYSRFLAKIRLVEMP